MYLILFPIKKKSIFTERFCFSFANFRFCRKSAPKFLLDVYKQLNDEANGGVSRPTRSTDDEGENFITDTDKLAIEESDMIMTFLNQSKFQYIFQLQI